MEYNYSKNDKHPLLTGGNESSNQSLLLPQDNDYGVDFVHCGFDLHPDFSDLDSSLWAIDRWGTERIPGIIHPQLFQHIPFGNTYVEVEVRTLDWRCYVRFNPSRAVYGKSRQLLHPAAVEGLIEKLLVELQPLVFPSFVFVNRQGEFVNESDWASQVSLSRVDCARNLIIDDPNRFKLAAQKAQPAQNPTIHSFGKKGKSWGLVHGTVSVGQDRLYDKNADLKRFDVEASLVQDVGEWFRFEAELRSDRLEKFGLKRLSSLSDERVWNAILTRWEASRWGVTLSTPGSIVAATKDLSVNEKSQLFGYHSMHLLGLQDEIPQSRHRKYGKLSRDLGLQLDVPIEFQGIASRKVDIWHGKIIEL